jgi:3-oxoacyl-[acyl-carrier-protein] synthase II
MVSGVSHRDVWVTGVYLVSSLADGAEEHWKRLHGTYAPLVAEHKDTGILVHPMPALDLSSEISNPMDRKRMGQLQALGVYTAGRALTSAGLKGKSDLLSRAVVVVGCAGGERDAALDETIFAEATRFSDAALLNQRLSARMRPSMFLSQLPNLLAGNISILFGVTGGSRTTMGEEMAGVNAFKIGYQLTADGTYDLALVGAAFNAERLDLLLLYGFGQYIWQHGYQPVQDRSARGGGYILGSLAAFLVLEEAEHAMARGVEPWCRVRGLSAHQSRRADGDIAGTLELAWNELEPLGTTGPAGIISGVTGASPSTEQEMDALLSLSPRIGGARIWESGSVFGHGMEASFLFNLGLATLALRHGRIYPSNPAASAQVDAGTVSRLLVTSVGHSSGEAIALLSTMNS